MHGEWDVVIVGGGPAGGALAASLARGGHGVLVLERQAEYSDLVRGEMLSPWGMADAAALGAADALYAAGAWPLQWWRQWDETVDPHEAPVVELLSETAHTPHGISHHRSCAAIAELARNCGADVLMDARGVTVEPGSPPRVTFRIGPGAPQTVRPRLVVGAGGRYGRVRRQAGIVASEGVHHWGSGLAVAGLEGWPAHTQAMGTDGDAMFFVFPQGRDTARLYLNYASHMRQAFAGPDGVRRFLDAFRLPSLPHADLVANATPVGPLASFPGTYTLVEQPVAEGVVLVGDEAGMTDTVLGVGLSNAFRDARVVSEILLDRRDWTVEALKGYVDERRERMRLLHLCADLMARLFVEFGPEARERRARALRLMREQPAYALFLAASLDGPERLPGYEFADYLRCRLTGAL
jgi:2-polyprenyl-6-methoxyphenol hydroxylase-like FAD-dependent oxidoreductase